MKNSEIKYFYTSKALEVSFKTRLNEIEGIKIFNITEKDRVLFEVTVPKGKLKEYNKAIKELTSEKL